MKFTDLAIMTQLAVAADLSTLSMDPPATQFSHYGAPNTSTVPLNTEAARLIKEAGIELTQNLLVDVTAVHVTKEPRTSPYPSLSFGQHLPSCGIRFSRHSDGTELYINLGIDVDKKDNLVFDRFGVMGSIRITGDLESSLLNIMTMLESFKVFSSATDETLYILKELHTGVLLAKKLPEKVIIAIAGSRNLAATFQEVVKLVTFNDYDYDEDTGNRINLPPIICESNGMLSIVTYYTYMHNALNQNRLVVALETDKDTGARCFVATINYNGSQPIEIGRTLIEAEITNEDFLKQLINDTRTLVESSTHIDVLRAQLEHFITTVKGATPFILNTLSKK